MNNGGKGKLWRRNEKKRVAASNDATTLSTFQLFIYESFLIQYHYSVKKTREIMTLSLFLLVCFKTAC